MLPPRRIPLGSTLWAGFGALPLCSYALLLFSCHTYFTVCDVCLRESPESGDVLEPTPTCSWEFIVFVSSQLHVISVASCGQLEICHVGVFRSQKAANATNKNDPPSPAPCPQRSVRSVVKYWTGNIYYYISHTIFQNLKQIFRIILFSTALSILYQTYFITF